MTFYRFFPPFLSSSLWSSSFSSYLASTSVRRSRQPLPNRSLRHLLGDETLQPTDQEFEKWAALDDPPCNYYPADATVSAITLSRKEIGGWKKSKRRWGGGREGFFQDRSQDDRNQEARATFVLRGRGSSRGNKQD